MKRIKGYGGTPEVPQHPFVPRVYVKEPIRWEYRVVRFDDDPPSEDALNELGNNGWELVAALTQTLYFKRLVD